MTRFITLSALLLALPMSAEAQVLNFDDVTTACDATIPNGYGGFDWTNFGVVDKDCHGVAHGVRSGDYAATNFFGELSLLSGGAFNFNSGWFAAWVPGSFSLEIIGFRGTDLVFERVFTVDNTSTLETFNWTNVTMVSFNPEGATDSWFLMDDLHAVVVPEPASMILLGTGLFGVAGAARRRKNRSQAAA